MVEVLTEGVGREQWVVNSGNAALKCWGDESFESWAKERLVVRVAKRSCTPDARPGQTLFNGCLVDNKTPNPVCDGNCEVNA